MSSVASDGFSPPTLFPAWTNLMAILLFLRTVLQSLRGIAT